MQYRTSAGSSSVFDLHTYRIRRKFLKIFGASFHIYDGDVVVGYSKQKAFKLKEDIRVYTDDSMTEELLTIHARQMIDFHAAYDIVDPRDGSKGGAARRKGVASLLRDSWEVLDTEDRVIGQLQEDSTGMALLRRFLSNLIPQTFNLRGEDGGQAVEFRQRFNPIIYSLEVQIAEDSGFDPRLLLGVAVLISAIEGRQS